MVFDKVFARSVVRYAPFGQRRGMQGEAFGKSRAQGSGKVGHLIVRIRMMNVQPLCKLLRPERRLPERFDDIGKFVEAI